MELRSCSFKFEIRFPVTAIAAVWASMLGLRNFHASEQVKTFSVVPLAFDKPCHM